MAEASETGTSGTAGGGGTANAGSGGAARWPEAAGGKVDAPPTPESVVKGAAAQAAATQSPRDLANYLRLRRKKK